MVSISRSVYEALPQRMAFEEKDYFSTSRRLDTLLCDDPTEEEARFA